MKKMMIMCGSGVATSTVVTGKIKSWLADENLIDKVTLYQSKVAEEVNHIDDYDVIVSTTLVPENIKNRVINGVPLLTGINADKVFAEIKKELTE